MKDANILNGDILIVDRSLTVKNKDIIIAKLFSEFTVKKIRIINKEFYLYPENSKYKPVKITESMDFEVFGVVSYIIHKTK
jgi:DNA polymerase V